ncbi:molybdopterin molybdotransferase MoeA [Sediminicola sp. 1XM1-17]|uniref:molybdopterin molybdotransferase MoeA n=1 Tax=Sediminicola sp. 1XM1-17 TaxID=3127702 RepID=UPI0030780D76
MITFQEAYNKVLAHKQDYGTEEVPLQRAIGRVLAENIKADRDFPPFDRVTKDGIALNYQAIEHGIHKLKIEAIVAAGSNKSVLGHEHHCVEIMTGAVMPENADTVVMYEHLTIENGYAILHKRPVKGQDIHLQGSDEKKGSVVLQQDRLIEAGEIGVLAAVGKVTVLVKKLPTIAIISTGNELVDVHVSPLPHQIRKSNIHSLFASLIEAHITPTQLHLDDEREVIKKEVEAALLEHDVLLLSGGVSKGKFDYIPEVLEELGVEKIFHRVLQRPGKPFWFGFQKKTGTIIFSFPGNPASTFANYHVYFKDWLNRSLSLPNSKFDVLLDEPITVGGNLSLFLRVKVIMEHGQLIARLITENGSGDLTSLAQCDGFIRLDPKDVPYKLGEIVPFTPTRRLL